MPIDMDFVSVKEYAAAHGLAERTVRNYCVLGKMPGAQLGMAMRALLKEYKAKAVIQIEDILDFHHRFEAIHPFQDGNGRVGRLIMFKECLHHGIVPFVITDELKMFYYRGLREWLHIPEFLTDTCLTAQDHYKTILDYFKIKY